MDVPMPDAVPEQRGLWATLELLRCFPAHIDNDLLSILITCSTYTPHILFRRPQWKNISDEDWILLHPALVIASLLIQSPQSTELFHAFFFGPRTRTLCQSDPNSPHPLQCLSSKNILSAACGQVHESFERVPIHKLGTPQEECDKVSACLTEVANWTTCSFHDLSDPNFVGTNAAGYVYGLNKPVYVYKDAQVQRPCHSETFINIHMLDELKNAARAADVSTASTKRVLEAYFSISVTLVHEMAHASCVAAHATTVEPSFGKGNRPEFGHALDNALFGVEYVIDLVPKWFVPYLFLTETWDIKVPQTNGLFLHKWKGGQDRMHE